ncbi:hypothetical protein MATL_G00061300 [Megalops atlanticus]|uniref:Leucine-rich repeat-containing protein 74B n=1 Tax=Megalops atlanticus TaxID=7932 RepID=A0A9D3TDC7_MEGAT|nr:hypothetical protein MATL_G00061300 [Megalops atlanticus]
MVLGKKLAVESQLPSVLEDNAAEMESELVSQSDQVGGIGSRPPSRPRKPYSRGSIDNQLVVRSDTSTRLSLSGPSGSGAGEEVTNQGNEEEGQPSDDPSHNLEGEMACVTEDQDYDTDLELEDAKEPYDPTGETCYREACKVFGVVPVSYFLRNMHASELIMMHHGLGPQGTKALAVPLVTNTSILKLNLRDNWMEGLGGAAMAEMLKENCYIIEIDLSENRLGLKGAQAISSMLQENSTLVSINLSGNDFDDHAAMYLSKALMTNQKLEVMDLSHNRMGDAAGEVLGNAIAENTAIKDFNLSWNCIRGKGSVALAKGLGANIFLRKVDLSYNGFGKDGAVALGEALKINNILEELNISNNRIPPDGAICFAMGLQENKTIRTINMSRNPMQTAGCYGILKAIQENPESAMESLDFSEITVNVDFDELYEAVKETLPKLQVKHGGRIDKFKKLKPKDISETVEEGTALPVKTDNQ